MKSLITLPAIAAAMLAIVACTNHNDKQYIGRWELMDISYDGSQWDASLVDKAADKLVVEICSDGTVKTAVGDHSETGYWQIGENGEIEIEEQTAHLDKEGHLVSNNKSSHMRFKRI